MADPKQGTHDLKIGSTPDRTPAALVMTDYGNVGNGYGVRISMKLNTFDVEVRAPGMDVEIAIPVQSLLDAIGWQTRRMGN